MFFVYLLLTTVTGQEVQHNVRLIGGISWGRVEIYHNGIWGTVCSDTWGNVEARVVCRTAWVQILWLKLLTKILLTLSYDAIFRQGNSTDTTFGSEDGLRSWLSDVRCNGDEYSLHHCQHSGYGVHNCSQNKNVGVRCYNYDYVKNHLPTRLSLGPTVYEGHVEVEINGMWGGICDTKWNDINAQVVCRSLGIDTYYAMAVPKSGYAADNVVFPVWLTNVICNGSESNIGLCQYELWDQTSCLPNKTAGVICYRTVKDYIRLVDGNSSKEGRVEFYYRGQWGAFCGRWDDNHAKVVCRNLGFSGGVGLKNGVFGDGIYGNGNGKFWAQWIDCKGNETKITDCQNQFSYFDDKCVLAEPIANRYAPWRSPPQLLKNVHCWRDLNNLQDCRYEFWKPNMYGNDCRMYKDVFVGVNCIQNNYIRLVDGKFLKEGRIEIFRKGHWGGMCNIDRNYKAFGSDEAKTVCKTLGYSGGIPMEVNLYGKIDRTSIYTYDCGKFSRHIGECFQKDYASFTTSACNTFQSAVRCIEEDVPKELPVKLVYGEHDWEGIVEVLYDGIWWNICMDDWDINAARVVCRALGLRSFFAVPVPGVDFGKTDSPVLFQRLLCKGNETKIGACRYQIYKGDWRCRGTHTKAGVKCLKGIEVFNTTASKVDNKTEIECSETEQQYGYVNEVSDTNIIIYGVTSGLVMYAVIVTILTLVLAYLYLKLKQHRKTERQVEESLSEESGSDGEDKIEDTGNKPTTIITDGATEVKIEDKDRTEL
ncbi:hypothetical protein KUTeg_021797 [Tegillarca granosa]|uniref:SRCR domain-containing protein n=1 Tax=Tegillarca granosa TaxID=220873 RepID=A0ABQ9E4E6_TEGGR|nr:hypothetical protein KUTeg_021797 [Tegillarca granosa]